MSQLSNRSRLLAVASAALCLCLLLGLHAPPARGHAESFPIGGRKLLVRADADPARQLVVFASEKDQDIRLRHDPRETASALLIEGRGATDSRTALITLDPSRWSEVAHPKKGLVAWSYWDPAGTRGGVKMVILENGRLTVVAHGENWSWQPDGPQDVVAVWFRMEEEWFCSEFDAGSSHVLVNEAGHFVGRSAPAPGACREAVCGNGIQESGEGCDDGNLVDDDACANDCRLKACDDAQFASTFEAVQEVVFEGYGCANDVCHGVVQSGGLDLRAGAAYDELVGAPSTVSERKRVFPAEPDLSFLYEKLAAKTLGRPLTGGTPMPLSDLALSEEHLQGLYEWIRGGAPREGVVAGTADLFGTCLPEPGPLTIPVPEPPPAGLGVQLQQTPWDLPASFENEICMATYYDFYETDVVPEWAQIDCPEDFQYRRFCSHDESPCAGDADCGAGNSCLGKNRINPENKCFVFHRSELFQDPQSHHSIIHIYTGGADEEDAGWGDWTIKLQDQSDPREGASCDPTAVGASGTHPGCSGEVVESAACISYGPDDFSNFGSLTSGGGGNSPQFSGSQEPYYEEEFSDGVYDVLPMRGVVVWNSHAFNLTSGDSTMSQYLNLEFAAPEDQRWPMQRIFDASGIFTQNVPPFETREYCRTYTIPQGARLFRLSSHTHRTGVLWRVWLPPNEPCNDPCPPGLLFGCSSQGLPDCAGPRPSEEAVYYSTVYNDPLQLDFDEPRAFDATAAEDRTFLFCSVFDNGSSPSSPALKRQSTSPFAPQGLPVGGPCTRGTVACANEGPSKGQRCFNDDRLCDSAPGVLDGDCDACPVTGGLTTEDEMMILLGNYYLP